MSFKDKLIDGWLYTNLCWSRTWSHLVIPMSAINLYVLISIRLDQVGFKITFWEGLLVMAAFMLLTIYVGHLEIKYKVFARATSMSNQHNPELLTAAEKNGGKRV